MQISKKTKAQLVSELKKLRRREAKARTRITELAETNKKLKQDIAARKKAEKLLAFLDKFHVLINSTLDFDTIMRKIVTASCKAIGAESSAITLKEVGGWVAAYVYGLPRMFVGRKFSDKEMLLALLASNRKKAIAINDARRDKRVNRTIIEANNICSVLAIPVLAGEKTIGALFFNHHSKAVTFTKEQIDFANSLCASVSLALQKSRLFDELEKKLAECKQVEESLSRRAEVDGALAELSKALIQSAAIDEISKMVLQYATRLTRSAYGVVGYIDPQTGYLVVPTMAMEDVWKACGVANKDIVYKKFGGLWGWVLKNRKPLLTNDPSADPRSEGLPEGHLPINRFLSVPAMMGEKLVGQLQLANPDRDYTEQDLTVIERLAALYALAIQRERAEEELRNSETRYRTLSESLEQNVKEKVAELKQVESLAAVGQMVSIVAHEVRNPLQNIRLGVDTIRKEPASSKHTSDALAEIDYGVNLLNGLVGDLVDYSKPITLDYSTHSTNDIVADALKKQSHKLGNVLTRLELEEKDKKLHLDFSKITRALANLISNAADAMPNGGNLNIHSRFTEINGASFLNLCVSDTGCGIDEQNLQKIWEPFYTTKTFGTGLGILISRRIIEAHNGNISIASDPDVGTTVTITLPIGQA